MKKLFLLLIVALMATACEGPRGPEGMPGRDGVDGRPGQDGTGITRDIFPFTINEEDWIPWGDINTLNSYYYYSFEVKELTFNVLDYGFVYGYYFTADNNGDVETKSLLPYVRHYGVGNNTSEKLWTETIDIVVEYKRVTFYVTRSDFMTINRPETMNFELHIMQ